MATKLPKATVIYYDEEAHQVRICTVPRSRVQSAIDQASAMTVPPDTTDGSQGPITDEDARKLGGMALLVQGMTNPELRPRLNITTEAPMEWPPE